MRRVVVLLNLGGPSSLKEVKPFLKSLFNDPAILPYSQWVRRFVSWLIVRKRLPKATEIFRTLGGGSPLLKNTEAQGGALQALLGPDYRVVVAMRHAQPDTSAAFLQMEEFRPHEVILLPLYPQFSVTTTASSFEAWEEEVKKHTGCKPIHRICCYPEMTGLIDGIVDLTLQQMKTFQTQPRLLFSAHGLPQRLIKGGDPYQAQVIKTYKQVLKKLQEKLEKPVDSVVCYQSRVGPEKWTEPSLDTEIERASLEKMGVLIIPISFVSEHSETLVELDLAYRDMAQALGIPEYGRVPTVDCHPAFIQGLADLVISRTKTPACGLGWTKCWRR